MEDEYCANITKFLVHINTAIKGKEIDSLIC
jgi:hypothetical protein